MRARELLAAALGAACLFAQAGRADEAAPATTASAPAVTEPTTAPTPAATAPTMAPAPAVTAAKAPKPAAAKWFTSLSEAQAEARKSGKPILADFTGSDWCPWCIKLRAEVFNTKQFKDWAVKNVVLLEVDFPEHKPQSAATKQANEALADKYQVDGFPTVLFLTADGKVLGTSGYEPGGPAPWTARAQKILDASKTAAK